VPHGWIPSWRFGTNSPSPSLSSPDVIVLGGGVSGLAAAGRLVRAGRKVVLLEARSRLGGRVHTIVDPATGHPVELGAEFLQGRPHPLLDILESAGVELQQVPERHERSRGGSLRHFPDVERLVRRLLSSAGSGDMPVAELIRQRADRFAPDELEAIRGYLEGFHAADLERFGTAALAENQEAEAEDASDMFRLAGGYGQLITQLASRLDPGLADVRTGTVATRLTWAPGVVEIEARSADGRALHLSAPQMVLALPLSTLKAPREQTGALLPEPVPLGWRSALECLEMGAAQHIVLRFESAWWIRPGRRAPVFMHGRGERVPVWWTSSPPKAPFLTGWAGGPRAASLAGYPLERLIPLALQSAASIFGVPAQKLAEDLRAAYSYDWSTDPYARGGYSYGGVGAAEARQLLRRPVEKTLFLAGEALAEEGRNATVPGALTSGLRSAEAALRVN
jgi:monoamine oxidase